MRTIVIGDIHGCVDEFQALVQELNLTPEDRLLLLGDLIDKGPDPAGVVTFARHLGAECLIGNHEEKAIRWMKHERRKQDNPKYRNPMREPNPRRLAQWFAISDSDWGWLASRPFFLKVNDYWSAVHAGCLPGLPLEQQDPNDLMRMRYVHSKGQPSGNIKYKMASLNEKGEVIVQVDGNNQVDHWTELWAGLRNIVYGHYVRLDEVHHTTKSKTGTEVQTLGLDTGCVNGGSLTAAIFEDKPDFEIVQVKAFKTYSKLKPWDETED